MRTGSVSRALTGAVVLAWAGLAQGAIVFDDFNVDEGHFNVQPTFSGSTTGLSTGSTADRVTSPTLEGAGAEQLVLLDDATPGGASRLRFLSGTGTPANNISFTTGAGEDGWIGFYLRTTDPGWTAQIWIEGPENNGSVPKTVIADGEWHLYEWNLDDESGGPDGWGPVAGIADGDPDVQAGTYTIDSILLRHTNMPASSTIYLDFVAKSDSGSIAALVPEPASILLLGLGGVLLRSRGRRAA